MSLTGAQQTLFRDSGFTLLDLITALALFGILTAIAVPNWASQLPTYRLNGAARQVQSELHGIKSQAIAGNADFRIVFLSSNSYKIERKEGAEYKPTGEQRRLPDGITFAGGTADPIRFSPRGTADSRTLKLCNGKHEGKEIILSGSTGRVRVAGGVCSS